MKTLKKIIIYIVALTPILFATTSCSDIPPLDEWLTANSTTYYSLDYFSATSYPTDSDTWEILDSSVSDVSGFDGLQAALGSAEIAEREISLVFPNLKEIPSASSTSSGALYSCDALISVEFPLVTSIGSYAFSFCSALTSVEFPLVTSISSYAFSWCDGLTSVEFSLATSIGSDAFFWCRALTSVEFPLVTSIGDSAFRSCTALTSVEFPLIASIGSFAFSFSSALTSVELATGSGITISSISSTAFYDVTTTNISLSVGSSNSSYVSGNTLTVGSNSWEFKEINLK